MGLFGFGKKKASSAPVNDSWDDDDDEGESLSVYDAALIWMSNGKDEKVADTDKCWWVQTEAVIALLNTYQLTEERKYAEDALLTWDFIKKYMIDYKDGEWHGKVSKDEHKPYSNEAKAGIWKCPYHNSRMCMEVAERVDVILTKK